jgi:hypothetical protein
MMQRRQYQRPIPPVDLPAALRAALARPSWPMADQFAREEIFASYRPKIATALAQDHAAVAGPVRRAYYEPPEAGKSPDMGRWRNSWWDAFTHTKGQHSELKKAKLERAFDEQDIRDYADNYSRLCSQMGSLEKRVAFTLSIGIEPPEGRDMTDAGMCARMDDAQWWRRKLRAHWTRRAENVMRQIGIVRRGREPYASDDAVMHRQVQKARSKKFLENHVAENEAGEQLELLHLAEHSLSNPALRRGEFMCRVRGFEEISDKRGDVAQFWTLTTPSHFHAQLATGQKNDKYSGATAREAQGWLCEQWARVRAKLKRKNLLFYGFRVAEPHHDGTPHWHLLMFCRPADADAIALVIRSYWIGKGATAEELGPVDAATGRRTREEARAKLIVIDRTKGSAVGYVAKYVSKNIDGAGKIAEEEDSETGRPVADGVRRVDAWASLHGIRQFQQIGGPPIGLWRELRRLTESSDDADIERCRAAADGGDFAGFIRAVSFDGIKAGRRVALKLEREVRGELTKYAEEPTPPVVGVRYCSRVEITRTHQWRIQRAAKKSKGRPTAEAAEAALPMVSERPGVGTAGSVAGHVRPEHTAPRSCSFIFSGGIAGHRLNPIYWSRRGRQRNPARSVMNPPASAALGAEAGNRVSAKWHDGAPGPRARSIAPMGLGGMGVARPAVPPSFSYDWNNLIERFARTQGRYPGLDETRTLARNFLSGSGSDSALGPVAITVRTAFSDAENQTTGPPNREKT